MLFLNTFGALVISLNDLSHRATKQNVGAATLLFGLVALFKASVVGAVTIGSGFSAMWFDPARNGEGLQLEILNVDSALVEWFTYDEQGGQRWFQSVGKIVHGASADSIEFPQLYVTHGGRFGPTFNPSDVQIQPAGEATLKFNDCDTGTFHYDAFGQSQTLPIQRLTHTMGAGCTPINGVPGEPVMARAGESGSWFDISHSGEGFELQWLTNNQALVIWYTYDASGNQVWLEGVGGDQDGAIVFEHVARTSGPHFGTAYDPAAFQEDDWGTLTLQLDCNQGVAHYASRQAGFGSGDLSLSRLTKLEHPSCPTLKPKFSELYDISWNELPIEMATPQNPSYLAAESIAENGTVAGRRNGHLVLWHPDTQAWEDVPRELGALSIDISPDGSAVMATDDLDFTDFNSPPDVHTLLWQRSTDWQALPGLNLSMYSAVSHNFKYVVGTGRDAWDGADQAWVQEINGVQQLLPLSATVPGASPSLVSNDGNTILGGTLRFQGDWPVGVGIRWGYGAEPTILHNPDGEELPVPSACDANCNIIFGPGRQAWYLKSDGTFGYLGTLPDAYDSYRVSDATPDGSLVVGTYTAYENIAHPDFGVTSRAFIWTEATGIVSVRSLVDELRIGDDDWHEIDAVRVSPDGRKILLGGYRDPDLYQARAVVVQLVPKSSSD